MRRPRTLAAAAVLAVLSVASGRGGASADGVPTFLSAIDADGKPIVGAEVVEVRPDASGVFIHDASATVLAVTGRGGSVSPLPSPSSKDGRLAVRSERHAAVLLPASVGPVMAALWESAPLDGSLLTPEGTPAAGLSILALPLPGVSELAHRARSDDLGRFKFAHLPPGRYRLRVIRADGTAREMGTVNVIAAGTTLKPMSLVRGAILKGRVLDGDGAKPVAGLSVSLKLIAASPLPVDEGEMNPEAVTGADGRLLFTDVLPGVYEAHLLDPARIFDGEPPRIEVDAPRMIRLETWWSMRRVAVAGKVLDGKHLAVVGASVLLDPAPGAAPPEGGWAPKEPVSTGADGAFRIAGVAPSREYRLVAWAPGYAPSVESPLSVDRGGDTDIKWIVLLEPWTLEVTVKDQDGKPIAGAEAVATPDSRPDPDAEDVVSRQMLRRGVTDAAGVATIRELPAGDVVVIVSHAGFVTASSTVPRPVVSRARSERMTLARTASIEGRVTTAEGPISPVRIRAIVRRPAAERIVTPNSDGSFRFDDLPPNPTDIEVVPAAGNAGLILARRESVVPGSGEPVILEIAARHGVAGELSGISAEGGPAVVRLEAGRLDTERDEVVWQVVGESPVTSKGDAGLFEFADVPPGTYAVRGVQGLRDTGPVSTRVEDRDLGGVVLLLPQASRISGVVLDARSRGPRLGAKVTLVRLQGDGDAPVAPNAPGAAASSRPAAVTGDDGRFLFEGVASGLYRVEASDRDLPAAAAVVRTIEGETAVVPDLKLSVGGRIAGRVHDEGGAGLVGMGIRVFALPGLEERPRTVTTDDGAFLTAGLAAGRYRLRAGGDSPSLAKAPALEAEVEVVEGETVRVELGAGGRGRIEGVVRRRGHVVPGVAVEARLAAWGGSESVVLRTSTDAAGKFRWDGLPAGRYVILLQDGSVKSGATVDLSEGDRVLRDLELEEGRIAGHVVSALGDPVVGAEIFVQPSPGCDCEATGRTRTGPDGRFVFAGLPLALYRLEVSPPSLPARVIDSVRAELPGSERPVEVIVGAGSTFDLRVVDLGHRGVTAAEVWIETLAGVPLHSRAFYTGPSGLLHVEGFPEGPARVVVHGRGYGRPAPRNVALKDGVPSSLEVALRPATSLVLMVAAGRDPVARARVDLLRAGSEIPVERHRTLGRVGNDWGITPRTGVLTIGDLEEGDYVLLVTAGPWIEDVRMPIRVRGTAPTEVRVEMHGKP